MDPRARAGLFASTIFLLAPSPGQAINDDNQLCSLGFLSLMQVEGFVPRQNPPAWSAGVAHSLESEWATQGAGIGKFWQLLANHATEVGTEVDLPLLADRLQTYRDQLDLVARKRNHWVQHSPLNQFLLPSDVILLATVLTPKYTRELERAVQWLLDEGFFHHWLRLWKEGGGSTTHVVDRRHGSRLAAEALREFGQEPRPFQIAFVRRVFKRLATALHRERNWYSSDRHLRELIPDMIWQELHSSLHHAELSVALRAPHSWLKDHRVNAIGSKRAQQVGLVFTGDAFEMGNPFEIDSAQALSQDKAIIAMGDLAVKRTLQMERFAKVADFLSIDPDRFHLTITEAKFGAQAAAGQRLRQRTIEHAMEQLRSTLDHLLDRTNASLEQITLELAVPEGTTLEGYRLVAGNSLMRRGSDANGELHWKPIEVSGLPVVVREVPISEETRLYR